MQNLSGHMKYFELLLP